VPPWGEVALALGVLASIPAIAGFVLWIAEQRRRPDIRFLWKLSTTGAPDDLEPWSPGYEAHIEPGCLVLVEASVKNVGDAAAEHAMTNFVAPTSVGLAKVSGEGPAPTATQVGGEQVQFVVARCELQPGNWQLQRFELTLPDASMGVRLRLTVSDQRLNASGSRWLPSRLVGDDTADKTAYGDPWPPPRPTIWRQWARVRTSPHGQVWCTRGERADVRDVRVTASKES
jgi:hypothetical protein